jgi:ribonucleoside-diphosphate reductase beta chain
VSAGAVWDNCDRRMKAKGEAAANDAAAGSDAGGEGPDMFEAAGVAAE